MSSVDEATVFLATGSFGPSSTDAGALVGLDAADWVRAEFAKPMSSVLDPLVGRAAFGEDLNPGDVHEMIWDRAIIGDDQLRQRMVFALSQVLVVSDSGIGNRELSLAHYIDILGRNAFGNYRQLLEDVTYSPAMARYLTYLRNRKGDPNKGRMPDENYAREIMQLFTIGLVELNQDGTVRTDGTGASIATYTNDDITGLARVFTGLTEKGENFWRADPDGGYSRLVMYDDQHSELEKTFLGVTIPAGTSGDESIAIALDTLFEHPNMGPFLARQLIQRFTASHPAPAYVERVANAFDSGRFTAPDGAQFGTGERGDLQATLAAVLLDASLFDGSLANDPSAGKIREPVLRFVHWARAFDVANVDAANESRLTNTTSPSDRLGQQAFKSPSVFNFYRPGYVAPGSETGARGLTAPELQIVNESSAVGFTNFMTDYVFNRSARRDKTIDTFLPDYSDELALADDPAALAEHLDALLTGGRMAPATKERIAAVLNEIPIRDDRVDEDQLTRVHLAVLMAVTAPSFTVQR